MSRLQPPPFTQQIADKSGIVSNARWKRFLIDQQRILDIGIAPADAPFVITQANSDLTHSTNLGVLASGYLKITTAVGEAVPSTTVTIPTTDLSGVLQAAQFPALTGDATTVAGALAVTVVRAPAGTLTGTTLAANVVTSSLTSVGTLVSGATGAGFTVALSTSTITGTLADARLSANVPLLNAANTFTTGPQTITQTFNAAFTAVSIVNTTDNTAALARMTVTAAATIGALTGYPASFTTVGSALASSVRLDSGTAAGGIGIATGGSGPIIFYATSGGAFTGRSGQMHVSGGFSWGSVVDPGALSASVAGDLIAGGTAAVLSGRITASYPGNTRNGIVLDETANTSATGYAYFSQAGTAIGSITRVLATAAVAFNTTSDVRFKSQYHLATECPRLRLLDIYDFVWTESGIQDRGVLAQLAEPIYPLAITKGSDGSDLSRPWGVDYSKFVSDLVVGWQEHDRRLFALESARAGA